MSDKQPTQAMPDDTAATSADGTAGRPAGSGGQSEGGAYPNPHTGHGENQGGFMGHGGQSRIDYSGTGTGSGDPDEDVGNVNAVTGKS